MNMSGGSRSGSCRVVRKRVNEALGNHLDRALSHSSKGPSPKYRRRSIAKSESTDKLPIEARESGSKRKSIEEYESDSGESKISVSDDEDASWVSGFCNARGHEFFCEIDNAFVRDEFTMCGLTTLVPYFEDALGLILGLKSSRDPVRTKEQKHVIESAAEVLYGLIHARYIVSDNGLAAMWEKYNNCEFGRCPRVFCCGQPCLPVGESDATRLNTVKIYCPRCDDIYTPRSKCHAGVDGAYFGTTFPHLFLMMYPNLEQLKATQTYAPRIFGYKVHMY